MAGRSNIIWWLEQRGYEKSPELIEHLFTLAKSQRRLMPDEEVEQAVIDFNNN
jgi:hypothetical protein